MFNSLIRKKLGESITPVRDDIKAEEIVEEHEDEDEEPRIIPDV